MHQRTFLGTRQLSVPVLRLLTRASRIRNVLELHDLAKQHLYAAQCVFGFSLDAVRQHVSHRQDGHLHQPPGRPQGLQLYQLPNPVPHRPAHRAALGSTNSSTNVAAFEAADITASFATLETAHVQAHFPTHTPTYGAAKQATDEAAYISTNAAFGAAFGPAEQATHVPTYGAAKQTAISPAVDAAYKSSHDAAHRATE